MLKRIFSALLALALLLSAFVSCRSESNDQPPLQQNPITHEFDLKQLKLIYPQDAGADLLTVTEKLYSAIVLHCGESVGIGGDLTTAEAGAELLIGPTSRKASGISESKLPRDGAVLCVIDGKLCLSASCVELMSELADEFIEAYIKPSADGRITLEGETVMTKQVEFDLKNYKIVLPADKDAYELDRAGAIATHFAATLGVTPEIVDDDKCSYFAGSREIIIGDADRPEVIALKNELGPDEYGVFIRGNKILLFGRSLATTILSAESFLAMLKRNVSFTDSGMEQETDISKYEEALLRREGFHSDIPIFPSQIVSAYESGIAETAFHYADVDDSAVESYCDGLQKNGYVLYSENRIGKYRFRVLKKSGSALYLRQDDAGNFRIISASNEHIVRDIPSAGEKVADLSITQLCLDYTDDGAGMSYIITLEDGRFVVVDGGYPKEVASFLKTLKSLNKRDGKPVIAAWIITHTHSDHSGMFKNIVGRSDEFELQNVILNLPGEYTYFGTNHSSYNYPELKKTLESYSSRPELIVPQSGDRMKLSGIELEFIYTHIDWHPNELTVFNDASTVFRVTAAGQTILFLGDIQTEAADYLADMYGDALKSDMVQLAHHGYQNGGSVKLYSKIVPSVAFWPSSPEIYDTRINRPNGKYLTETLKVDMIKATHETITLKLPYKK